MKGRMLPGKPNLDQTPAKRDHTQVTTAEKRAYRLLLYHGFLRIRTLSRTERPSEANTKLCLALSEWLHELARFSALDFEGFRTSAFWSEHDFFRQKHPELEQLRALFKRELEDEQPA